MRRISLPLSLVCNLSREANFVAIKSCLPSLHSLHRKTFVKLMKTQAVALSFRVYLKSNLPYSFPNGSSAQENTRTPARLMQLQTTSATPRPTEVGDNNFLSSPGPGGRPCVRRLQRNTIWSRSDTDETRRMADRETHWHEPRSHQRGRRYDKR